MGILGKKKDQDKTDEKVAKKGVAPKSDAKKAVKKTATKEQAAEPTMQDLYSENNAAAGKSAKGAKAKKVVSLEASQILRHPLITEKAASFGSANKYVFVVSGDTNKVAVAKAIQAVYGVTPVKVNIVCLKGKAVARGRIKGRRSDIKKAVVTLKKGDSIQIYEGV